MHVWRLPAAMVGGSLAVLSGCGGGGQPEPLAPSAFYTPRTVSEAPLSVADQPGQIPVRDTQSAPASPPPPTPLGGPQPAPPLLGHPLGSDAATRPQGPNRVNDRAAATPQPPLDSSQYMTLGSLIAEVNGKPIFANKVLQMEEPILRDYAREYDKDHFEIAARMRIERTRDELVREELLVAAADRVLSSDEKDMAKMLTMRWRDDQINEAGGSLEVARRKAAAQGRDFTEMEDEQRRTYLVEIYQYKYLYPQIQITAADIRNYYNAHLDSDYTHRAEATFRWIKSSPDDFPNNPAHADQMARERLEDFRKRVDSGIDFARLPATVHEMTIEPDSFALRKVDSAVWTLPVGQVSPVITDSGDYYIIQVEKRQNGGVIPFDDETLQAQIHQKLWAEQAAKLNLAETDKLIQSATLREDDQMVDAAVDIAMENYPEWSR